MYKSLGQVKLKSGESVEAAVLHGPEPDWADRIIELIGHKGQIWNEQNRCILTQNRGIDTSFYLLLRDKQPFANILITQLNHVAMLGHVYTLPGDRKKGAMAMLMDIQMNRTRGQGAKAIFLVTEFNTHPFRLYERFGFTAIEPQSGQMHWYADSHKKFDDAYFAPGPTAIEPLGWGHWPASAALCMGNWPGVVRCAPIKLTGRTIGEESLLHVLLARESPNDPTHPRAEGTALINRHTSAVVGLTAWSQHPLWPRRVIVDVYCHPQFWPAADELFDTLAPPQSDGYIAYADETCPHKLDTLGRAGFKKTAVLTGRIPADAANSRFLDITVLEKN